MVISSPTVKESAHASNIGRRFLTDLARGPADAVLVGIHAVHYEFTTTTDIVDRVFKNLDATGSLNDNVESVRVLALELLELNFGVGPRERNVFVSGTELLGQLHLQTLRGSNDNVATTILAQHLGEDKTGGTGTEHEDRRAHLGCNLVQSVCGARSGFKQGGIDVAEILDLENTAGWNRFSNRSSEVRYKGCSHQDMRSIRRNRRSW